MNGYSYKNQESGQTAAGAQLYRTIRMFSSWILAILLAFMIQRFAFDPYRVYGQSMEPALHQGDYLIVSKLGATAAKLKRQPYIPERGNIVVLESPLSDDQLIKRVIGLPGEHIVIKEGRVTIYNDANPRGFDPYETLELPPAYAAHAINLQVPDGYVFVIGDNRELGGSSDSRNELGPVSADTIIGKTAARLWPFDQIRTF